MIQVFEINLVKPGVDDCVADIDYTQIRGLRIEAAQKLQKLRPENIGRASRISGVSPSDISVLLIYLSQGGKQ